MVFALVHRVLDELPTLQSELFNDTTYFIAFAFIPNSS